MVDFVPVDHDPFDQDGGDQSSGAPQSANYQAIPVDHDPFADEQASVQDAFEAAAQRTRQAVRPEGGRKESLVTRLPEALAADVVTGPIRSAMQIPDFVRGEMENAPGQLGITPEQAAGALNMVGVAGAGALGASRSVTRLIPVDHDPFALEKRSTAIYNPPIKPPRRFAEDYPGVQGDGRLTTDIEGRPLGGGIIAGRQVVGGADVAVPPAQYDAITKDALGRPNQGVPKGALPRGTVGAYRVEPHPDGTKRGILFDQNLSADDYPKVVAHEMGHMIEDLAGNIVGYDTAGPVRTIPSDGVIKQLRTIYNDLNNSDLKAARDRNPNVDPQNRPALRNFGPEESGYKGDHRVHRELWAEAVRAYMTDPNYIKTTAPDVAARIRQYVNPKLSSIIQFNASAPFALAPVDHDPFEQQGAPPSP